MSRSAPPGAPSPRPAGPVPPVPRTSSDDLPGGVGAWTARSDLALLQDQLDGLSAWHHFVRDREFLDEEGRVTREMRLDAQRRLQALRRANQALLARTDDTVRETHPVLGESAPRAVVVHRQGWVRGRVSAELEACGVEVVAQLEDGADALGVVVADQPDLALVEDALPSIPGLEVIRQARRLAPHTLMAAQVGYNDDVARMLEAGASAAFARRVPPGEVAAGLARLVQRSPSSPA